MGETRFETYLESQGWQAYHWNCSQKKYEQPVGYYSSIGNVSLDWFPPNVPPCKSSTHITCGLNEMGMPPTLIAPRPIKSGIYSSDHEMERIFEAYTPAQVLTAILNGTTLDA